MAADVLGLRATKIFVGPDEQDHVGYCRDLAACVNQRGANLLLPMPARIEPNQMAVPGLNGQAMSKTRKNIVPIFAAEKEVRRLFRTVPVETVGKKEPINPDTDISFTLYSRMASADQVAAVRGSYLGAEIGASEARQIACDQFCAYFGAARQQRAAQQFSENDIEEILLDGQRRVRREMRNTVAILEDYLYHNFGKHAISTRLP
jgi:tryptophanyl-tRNA synthetase